MGDRVEHRGQHDGIRSGQVHSVACFASQGSPAGSVETGSASVSKFFRTKRRLSGFTYSFSALRHTEADPESVAGVGI